MVVVEADGVLVVGGGGVGVGVVVVGGGEEGVLVVGGGGEGVVVVGGGGEGEGGVVMTHYDEHKAVLMKWMYGARAEYHGYCNATSAAEITPEQCSPDPYLQMRFQLGRTDGLAKLAQDDISGITNLHKGA